MAVLLYKVERVYVQKDFLVTLWTNPYFAD